MGEKLLPFLSPQQRVKNQERIILDKRSTQSPTEAERLLNFADYLVSMGFIRGMRFANWARASVPVYGLEAQFVKIARG